MLLCYEVLLSKTTELRLTMSFLGLSLDKGTKEKGKREIGQDDRTGTEKSGASKKRGSGKVNKTNEPPSLSWV